MIGGRGARFSPTADSTVDIHVRPNEACCVTKAWLGREARRLKLLPFTLVSVECEEIVEGKLFKSATEQVQCLV